MIEKNITKKVAPVVVVMGHIDHGKSTLLDYIRSTNITAKEAGGITQHISAYKATHEKDGVVREITFLDTPGHEAFRSMRARGAQAADIAILVVSAEDGVKPQTIEAIDWITQKNIPMLVAFNKIDRPGANIEKAKQSLAENNVLVEGWGGQVSWVAISAKTGEGIPELLDTIILVADLENVGGDPTASCDGIVIESHLDPRKGVTATVIVRNGVLKKKGFAVAQGSIAPLRMVEDFAGKPIEEITTGSPARIIGWSEMPASGSPFMVVETKNEAETVGGEYGAKEKEVEVGEKNDKEQVPIIVKADTSGSLDAILYEISKFTHERITPKIVSATIGAVGENDVKTAQGTKDTLILAFHTKVDSGAQSLAERTGIVIHSEDVIYKLTEWLNEAILKRAPVISVEETTGKAKILKFFSKTKDKQVIGGRVESGIIGVGGTVKIMRRDNEIGTGKIKEMQNMKQKVNETSEGKEFGALLETRVDVAPGDYLVSFTIKKTQ